MANRKDVISERDQKLFQDIQIGLILYVTQKINHISTLDSRLLHSLNAFTMMNTMKAIAEHPEYIDEFVHKRNVPGGKRGIAVANSWKRMIHGFFYLYRVKTYGAIFIRDDGEVYVVKGMEEGFDDLRERMPFKTECSLYPFEDSIVSDGLITYTSSIKDPSLLSWLQEKYDHAVENNLVHYTL